MDHPTEVTLQDVRCFEGEQRGRLRPITLLVGENSTGKTTFLGCYRVLSRLFSEYGFTGKSPDFNIEPLAMGSFHDIVRTRRGTSGPIDEFKLGLAFEAQQDGTACRRLTATFCEEGSRPAMSSLRLQFGCDSFLEFQRGDEGDDFQVPRLPDVIPVGPLRSKPERTCDPVDETHWNSLRDGLVEFGRCSGLFSDIKVKRNGEQMSDPFEIQIKVRSGPIANIADVGAGVSQSLPLLLDIMAANDSSRGPRDDSNAKTFLLQQPEAHLHPRGQAELASLFVEAFKKRRNRFLIETHSDYIVDRVRISVRQGLLEPDDVSILYFEPKGNAVKIHNMGLDEAGNLEDVPAGYRDFFLKETDKLLGFAD